MPSDDNLFLHYKGYKPPTPQQRKAEEDKRKADALARKKQAAADREAMKLLDKAQQYQAILEKFRKEVTDSDRPDWQKEMLIKKSYLW